MNVLTGKRIGLLTASASRLGGGVFEAVVAQAELIRSFGAEPVVIALADRHSSEDRRRFGEIEVQHAAVLGPGQIGFAPGLSRALLDSRLDLLHQHGIWMYPTRAAGNWARASKQPYLISPHGMLDPWITARGRWKKALARAGYERRSWRLACAFHALTAREALDIAEESGRRDTVVIANAGPAITARTAPRGAELVYLGRIHPKKNLGELLRAWSALEQSGKLPAQARLTIAGWGDPADLAGLERQLAAGPRAARFVGPVYGEAKARLLNDAAFVVLPSLSEGLPMVVLEAWAAGTPVLMSGECNLPEGFAAGAALDCGMSGVTVAGAIADAFELSDAAWTGMSQAASRLAATTFGSATIASRWARTYAALMQGTAP